MARVATGCESARLQYAKDDFEVGSIRFEHRNTKQRLLVGSLTSHSGLIITHEYVITGIQSVDAQQDAYSRTFLGNY